MPRIAMEDGRAALAGVREARARGERPPRRDTGTAVRYLLQLLEERAPGRTVEVRVPPHGAVQIVEGPRHTRGTPPNVVELDPLIWIDLATGERTWQNELAAGRISASGTRADVSGLLPLLP